MPFLSSGSEFLVNTAMVNNQTDPVTTVLADGRILVAWTDYSGVGDTSGSGIKACLFDAAGNPLGSEFLVNTATLGAQYAPVVTALAGGGFVIGWTDASHRAGDFSSTGVKAQVYAADAVPIGSEALVNSSTFNAQMQPALTSLANGGYLFVWTDASGVSDHSYTGVVGQMFDATGAKVGGEFLINTSTFLTQYLPSVAGLKDGGFVSAWSDVASGDVIAQRFDATGAKVGLEFTANTMLAGTQTDAKVVALAGGGFAIAWDDNSLTGGDTNGLAVRAQVYDAAGNAVGGEFLVNTATAGDQTLSGITALAGGGFAVSWTDASMTGGDTSGLAVRAQAFDATGHADGGELLLATNVTGDQLLPALAGLASGGFVASWADASGIGGDLSGTGVKAQIFVPQIVDHVLVGTAGGDTLDGGLGNDTLSGLGGNDQLFGHEGNDVLLGGPGNDLLDGGAGIDTASYAGAATGVHVNLATVGPQATGDGRDTLVGIENLTGSAFSDQLTGDGGVNVLSGGAGNDTLRGGAGNDVLHGGADNDLLVGGAGADQFVFDTAPGMANVDRIGDFTHLEDTLVFSSAVFTALGAGPLADAAFTIGTHATTADQHLIYNAVTGALYYDADGVGGAAQQLVARLIDHAMLAAADILVI